MLMHYAFLFHKVKKMKRIKGLMGLFDQKYEWLMGIPQPKGMRGQKMYINQKDKRTSRFGGLKKHCFQSLFHPNGTQKIKK